MSTVKPLDKTITILIDNFMARVRDYEERGTVENELESVLHKVGDQSSGLLKDLCEFFAVDDEDDDDDQLVETDLNWKSLKKGDEVLLTNCYVNRDLSPIRMVVMEIEEDMVALRECDRWMAVPWMSRVVFEKKIITHWTKEDNHD